jgi:MFS family permease
VSGADGRATPASARHLEPTVNAARTSSTTAGALFLAATVAALGAAALDPTLSGTNYLTAVGHRPDRLAASVLLYLAAAGTSVGIAIALYPVLKGLNATLALGSVIFRAIEAVLYAVAAVSLLSIVPLGEEAATTGPDSETATHAIANSLLSIRDHATLAGVLAFTLGALMYYTVFYRCRLVPRWLSGWGLLGVLSMMMACLMALFCDNPVTGYTVLILPIAVQEMVLALCLLFKGFDLPDTRSIATAGHSAPGGGQYAVVQVATASTQ